MIREKEGLGFSYIWISCDNFDFYVWRHYFLEAKNGSHQWETLENLFLKQIAKLRKKVASSFSWLCCLKNTHFLYYNYIHLNSLRKECFGEKKNIFYTPTTLHFFASKNYYWRQNYTWVSCIYVNFEIRLFWKKKMTMVLSIFSFITACSEPYRRGSKYDF